MKKFLFWVVYIVIIAVIFCVLAEIIFRLVRGAPNPLFEITQHQTGALLIPGERIHSVSSKEGEFVYDARVNNHGYRGADFVSPKPEGTTRVFFIGDSYTFGVGVQDNETIPYLVGKKLSEANPSIEVINAGVGHTGPAKHYINLKNIHLKHEPDAVVLLLDMTDIWDDWYSELHGVFDKDGDLLRVDPLYKNGKRDWWITLVSKSAFCRYLHDKVVRTFIKIKHLGLKRYLQKSAKGQRAKAVIANDPNISDDVKMEYDGLLMLRGSERAEMITRQWQRTAKYILKIKKILDERNIPMILVMYPHGIYVGAEEWNEGRATWGFEQHKKYTDYFAFDLVSAWAKQNNIDFINILPSFLLFSSDENPAVRGLYPSSPEKMKTGKYFYEWDGHMTADGYRVVAESIQFNPLFQQMILNKVSYEPANQQ